MSPALQVEFLPNELPGKPNASYTRKRTGLEPGGGLQCSSSSHIDHKACGIPLRKSQAQDCQGPRSQVPPQGQFQPRERHSSKDAAALWLDSELEKTVEVLSNTGYDITYDSEACWSFLTLLFPMEGTYSDRISAGAKLS